MKRAWTLRILCFVIAFQTEVRVRASSNLENKSYKSSPENCLDEGVPCAIEVQGDVVRFKQKGVAVHLSEKSFAVRESQAKWTWVRGTMWVESGNVEVKTKFAELKASRGGMWVVQDQRKPEDLIWILASGSDVVVTLRSGKTLTIPEGFQVWLGKKDEDSVTSFGMPETIEWERYVKLWGPIYPGSAKQFKVDLLNLKKEWDDLAERGGELYLNVVNRQIAMVKQEEENKKKAALAAEIERRIIRERFKKKTLEE